MRIRGLARCDAKMRRRGKGVARGLAREGEGVRRGLRENAGCGGEGEDAAAVGVGSRCGERRGRGKEKGERGGVCVGEGEGGERWREKDGEPWGMSTECCECSVCCPYVDAFHVVGQSVRLVLLSCARAIVSECECECDWWLVVVGPAVGDGIAWMCRDVCRPDLIERVGVVYPRGC